MNAEVATLAGVDSVIEKLQLSPAAKLAPSTLNIAVEFEFEVVVNVEPVPQLFAAGSAVMLVDGMTPAIS